VQTSLGRAYSADHRIRPFKASKLVPVAAFRKDFISSFIEIVVKSCS